MAHKNKVKGRAFELKIVHILKHIWHTAQRGMQFRGGGAEVEDVQNTPFHWECSKGGESIWAKWKQACADSKATGKEPIVVKQRDRENPVALVNFGFLLELLDPSLSWYESYRHEFKSAPK